MNFMISPLDWVDAQWFKSRKSWPIFMFMFHFSILVIKSHVCDMESVAKGMLDNFVIRVVSFYCDKYVILPQSSLVGNSY